jgi:fibronectin type III domain protein
MSSPRIVDRSPSSAVLIFKRVSTRSWLSAAAVIMTVLTSSSPSLAACTDRPGTPTNVGATAASPTEITVSWSNRTRVFDATATQFAHNMWFDFLVTETPKVGPTIVSPKSRTGWGPVRVSPPMGSASSTTFDGLRPGTKYCFVMRARTEGGTQGCISKIASNQGCATTPDLVTTPRPSAPPTQSGPSGPSGAPIKVLGKFRQFATAKNDVDIYYGPGGQFRKAPVFMRKGVEARVLGRHRDGWSRLELGVPGGENWVADDHLTFKVKR